MPYACCPVNGRLKDGTMGSSAESRSPLTSFEFIGTPQEQAPLVLAELQSYDEMALSALLGMSVPTHFINEGGRRNCGGVGQTEYVKSGIYVGLVGARFERPGLMEWKHLIVEPHQNTIANGYGPTPAGYVAGSDINRDLLQAWARFYGLEFFPLYEDARDMSRASPTAFIDLGGGRMLHVELYKLRMRLVIEPFLIDANKRANEASKRAYVHAVGLGLGVWMVHARQAQLILDVYADVLNERPLPNLAVVDFSWFPPECVKCGGARDGGVLGPSDVRIRFSRRDPAAELEPPPPDAPPYLLVAQYAWDGNSYPGNEYWMGMLEASGDPAAASCSSIDVLQNP